MGVDAWMDSQVPERPPVRVPEGAPPMRVREGERVSSPSILSRGLKVSIGRRPLSVTSDPALGLTLSYLLPPRSLVLFRWRQRKLNRNCNPVALRALPRRKIILGPPKSVKLCRS